MIKIAIANQKGGVGKTTTAVNLGHGLALKDKNVLIVDLDPQGQCASHLGMEQSGCVFKLLVSRPPMRDVVRTTGRDRLWILPGNKRTKTAEGLMVLEQQGVETVGDILKNQINGDELDCIVLDTAPSAGGLQENALYTSDILIIPAAVDYLSLEGVREVLQTLKAVQRPSAPLIRILPTFYDEVTNESKANLNQLQQSFKAAVLDPIHRAVILRECPAAGKTIWEHAPESRSADEYAHVVWEVIDAT